MPEMAKETGSSDSSEASGKHIDEITLWEKYA